MTTNNHNNNDDEVCGWPTTNNTACQNPATEPTGRCWINTHGNTEAENPHGRPSKFSDQRARDAIQAARESKSKAGCARAAGVAPNTLETWLQENPVYQDNDGEQMDFLQAFMRARSAGEQRLIQGGLADPNVNSQMAKFLLSTSFDYVKTERREVTGEGGGAVEVTVNEQVVETEWEP